MSRERISRSGVIRKRLKEGLDAQAFRENTAVRKKKVLEARLGNDHPSISGHVTQVQLTHRPTKIGIIGGTVANPDVSETSPGVYIVNVNSADPTGAQYFKNSDRPERIRKMAKE